MNEPWSGFQEVVFDVMLNSGGWDYIGFGRLTRFIPIPPPCESFSSLSRERNLALDETD